MNAISDVRDGHILWLAVIHAGPHLTAYFAVQRRNTIHMAGKSHRKHRHAQWDVLALLTEPRKITFANA